MKVLIVGSARADLISIGDYIATDSPSAAKRVVTELRICCYDLGRFPKKFPVVGSRHDALIRRRPHGKYLIVYAIMDGHVEVLRVLHSARDIDRLLFPEA